MSTARKMLVLSLCGTCPANDQGRCYPERLPDGVPLGAYVSGRATDSPDPFPAWCPLPGAHVSADRFNELIARWRERGFTEQHHFPGEYVLLIKPISIDCVRVYLDGNVWVKSPTTGEYERASVAT